MTTCLLLSTMRSSVVASCIFSCRSAGIVRLLLFDVQRPYSDGTHFPSLMTPYRCLRICGPSCIVWFAKESFGSTIQIGTFVKKSLMLYATSILVTYVTVMESHGSSLVA